MSQFIEGQGGPLVASNTVETLSPINIDQELPSAEDLDAISKEQQIKEDTANVTDNPVKDEQAADASEDLDEENTFDVSRSEFTELLDAFLRLYDRVEKFNIGAPHKI